MAKNFLDQIKTAVKNSGSSKKDILYFGADTSKRIRFLQELLGNFYSSVCDIGAEGVVCILFK